MIEIEVNIIKKEIGRRFKLFREAIEKTQAQLAKELKVYQSTITNIEVGKTFPGIKYLHYLFRKYGLNPSWILCDSGEMFGGVKKDHVQALLPALYSMQVNDPRFEKYIELLDLMQIPLIEHIMMGKLVELKAFAKEEIEAFKKVEKQENSMKS